MKTVYFEASDYGLYYDKGFCHRWMRPALFYSKLEEFSENENLTIEQLGLSIEQRPIYTIRYGRGKHKVLMWSQMHGNEPTATMAVVDLIHFLTADDHYNDLRNLLYEHIELTVVPMLNPDGAERFSRRNALNIDLNRDAARHAMPELNLLLDWVQHHRPHWAFNLHDQRNIFTVGDTPKSAAISFLAAAADKAKTLTAAREQSMNLITALNDVVQNEIPGHVGRYTDEFYPRALGEYFHQQKIPCVLIESGAYANDPLRQVARKMNFLCLVEALIRIAREDVPTGGVARYKSIPENSTHMLDLIVRKCQLKIGGTAYEADLGFLIKEETDNTTQSLVQKLVLQDVGDLQFHYGFIEKKGGVLLVDDFNLQLEKPANLQLKLANGELLIIEDGRML